MAPKIKKPYARYAEELQNKQPGEVKRKITATGEDVSNLPEKEIEEKILINREVEKARFKQKVASAIEADKPGMKPQEQISSETEKGFGEIKKVAEKKEATEERVFSEFNKELENKEAKTPFQSIPVTAKTLARGTLETLDSLRSLTTLGGRDTAPVKEARQTISELNKNMENDIIAISIGRGSVNEVEKNILSAMTANQKILGAAKKQGIRNAAYWLKGGGKDLEAEALENERMLKNMYQDLLIAKEQRRLAGL